MPRKKNTVVTTLIDVGNIKSIKQGIDSMERLADGLKHLNKLVATPLRINIKAKVMVPMLKELRHYPGRPHHPLRWKSNKQRRYVMAMLREIGQEDGYKRTYALARGWRYDITTLSNGSMVMRVWNEAESKNPFTGVKTKYEPFVQGSIGLGQSKTSAARYRAPIQPFHQDTGWPEAQPIVAKYTQIAREETVWIYIVRLTALAKRGK